MRGWREERVVPAYDTTGRAVAIVTGLTVDHRGRTVAVLAVGDGPSVILEGDISELHANIAAAIAAAQATGR